MKPEDVQLDVEGLAREFIEANRPEPLKCVNCGQPTPVTMCTSMAMQGCPNSIGGHVYSITVGGDPEEAELKRLVSFAKLALLRRVSAPEVVFEFSPSPCGHSSQYAYTEDGGKNIVCLVCERRVSGKGAQAKACECAAIDPDCSICKGTGIESHAPVPATPTVEYADPQEGYCAECKSSFGVHLMTCSKFRPNCKPHGVPDCKRCTTQGTPEGAK